MSEGRPSRSDSPISWMRRLSNLFLEPKDQEQLIELLRNASERHILDAEALSIVEGALSVSQMQARDIMIPRSQVVMISRDAPAEETLKLVTETAHSRFPLIDDDRDDVIGILLAKDLLAAVVNSGEFNFDLRELLRPAVFIPESKRLNVLLREFRARRNHMAIVVDEYGGVAGMITIEIKDTGVGIPPENLNKLFTPFFTTKPIGKGTGLGLAIVYGIIKMHRGQISASSKLNKGTTFTITLPIHLPPIERGMTTSNNSKPAEDKTLIG